MLFHTISAFALFLLIAAGFRWLVNRRGKETVRDLDTYLKREHEANYARKKTIDPSLFYIFNEEDYPFYDYTEIENDRDRFADVIKKQTAVQTLAQKKMLKFSPAKTNYELKNEFGFANLEHIIGYEENLNRFFAALAAWAEALVKADKPDDAAQILKNAIRDGCDLTKVFILLSEIYYNKKDKENLSQLSRAAENLERYQKEKIVSHITAKLNGLS